MLWWLAQNTLIAALLALAVSLGCRGRRFSPAVRHALWLVVLFKLVTPPMICYTLPPAEDWTRFLATSASGPAADKLNMGEVVGRGEIELPLDDAEVAGGYRAAESLAAAEAAPGDDRPPDGAASDSGAEHSREIASQMSAKRPLPWADSFHTSPAHATRVVPNGFLLTPELFGRLALAAWLLGSACVVSVQWVRLVRLRRLLSRSRPAPAWLRALVERSAALVGVAPPHARVTEEFGSPLVFALGTTRLVWPASLAGRLADESLAAVVVHELAHLRRRDHWVGWMELAASCVWWWNPLFWYVRHQLRENAELACDAWVVSLLPQGRRAYAQALIEVTQLVSWTAAPVPAVGMGAIARRTFERRLTMILRERVSCRAPLVGLAVIGLLALGVLPGWTQGPAIETASSEPPATPAKPAVAETPAAPFAAGQAAGPSVAGVEAPGAPAETRSELPAAATSAAAPANRESQLEQLEARLAQLLSEVRALRAPEVHDRAGANKLANALGLALAGQGDNLPHGADVQTLTRARYKLSLETAEAMAAFIGQWVKADVDVKVVADAAPTAAKSAPIDAPRANAGREANLTPTATLIVTASADDQARIGAFIELLSPPAAAPAGGARVHTRRGLYRPTLAVPGATSTRRIGNERRAGTPTDEVAPSADEPKPKGR